MALVWPLGDCGEFNVGFVIPAKAGIQAETVTVNYCQSYKKKVFPLQGHLTIDFVMNAVQDDAQRYPPFEWGDWRWRRNSKARD